MNNKLKNRHLQMIALGGVIGTGFFFGAAKSIQLTGPSIVLSYLIGGIVIYIIMRALGEMTVAEPTFGSFIEFGHKYMGSYGGFIVGWNAWFEYTTVCMVEITAVTFFLDYWAVSIPHWIICLIILCFFMCVNLVNVRFFGEMEFWFAGIKVLAIILMLLFVAYLLFFKHEINPNLSTYLNHKELFVNGIDGFALSLVIVMFSFGGIELVGIAASDTENPQKTVPRAINGVIIRILLFYVLTMIAIMVLYPYNLLSSNVSPFVDVFKKIGIQYAAEVMNIVAITAALSSSNSSLFGSSRMLCTLASNSNAPKFVSKISKKRGIPYAAVIATSVCVGIAVIVNYIYPKQALMYLLIIATASTVLTWFFILLIQLNFRKKIRTDAHDLKFKLHLFPYTNIFACIMLLVVLIVMTKMPDMMLSVYITPLWILALSVVYILSKKATTK